MPSMLSVANESSMLSVVILSVVMLSVVGRRSEDNGVNTFEHVSNKPKIFL